MGVFLRVAIESDQHFCSSFTRARTNRSHPRLYCRSDNGRLFQSLNDNMRALLNCVRLVRNCKRVDIARSKTVRSPECGRCSCNKSHLLLQITCLGIHVVACAPQKNHKNRTAQNNNQLIRDLFKQPEIGRRLNRMWPEDLVR
jgi:hypothetical protein